MKLDCLLIHVPKLNNYYDLFGKHMYCMFISMGLFAIADYINKNNYKVQILHLGLEQISNKKFSLQEYLRETTPKIVGLSLHWHHQSFDIIEVAKAIKRINPDTFIVLGGFTASYFHLEIMEKFTFVDAIVRGDGEIPFTDLLIRKSKNEDSLFSIPNLTWRNRDGRIVKNEIKYIAKTEDLDKLNFVNLKLLKNYELYIKYARDPFIWINGVNKTINSILLDKDGYFPLSIMRGCDVNCSFCGGSKISNMTISKRLNQVFLSVEKVVASLEDLKAYGYTSVFIDFSPLVDPRYLDNLLAKIKDRKIEIGCIAAFRSLPSKKLLSMFADTFKLNKSKIFLSPETSSETDRLLNKGYYFSNEELLETITHSTNLGIRTEIYFVLGLPFQTLQSLKEIKNFQKLLRKRFGKRIRIYTDFLALEPGSPMYIDPDKFEIIKTRNCFMDFYYGHSGERSHSWPDLGYYSENFLPENVYSTNVNKDYAFKNELKKIYCKDFCKLTDFFRSSIFIGGENSFSVNAASILSRLLCKIVASYWKLKEDLPAW